MIESNKTWYRKGLTDGVPIALGYFAVSFTLGITAKNAGFAPFQSMLTSMLINASAGEFAGFTLIGRRRRLSRGCCHGIYRQREISAHVLRAEPEAVPGHAA